MDRIQKGYYGYQFVPEVLESRLAALRSVMPMGSRVIDIGCNDGTLSLALLQSGHASCTTGIDFEDIRRDSPPQFTFIAADLRQFNLAGLPDADVVLCLNVIHHLCRNGIGFARDFMAGLTARAGTVICEMGSLTARIEANWLETMRAEWQTDPQCWADLFQAYAWRRPMMTYPFQFGRRVMWKLVSPREVSYAFDVLEGALGNDAVLYRLRRTGTSELFWSKSYKDGRARADHGAARGVFHRQLKDVPYDCLLPLCTHDVYGEIYAFDAELAATGIVAPREAFGYLTPAEQQELVAFGAQGVPAMEGFPFEMLCDFRVARTSRGLTFLHFEPTPLALKLQG